MLCIRSARILIVFFVLIPLFHSGLGPEVASAIPSPTEIAPDNGQKADHPLDTRPYKIAKKRTKRVSRLGPPLPEKGPLKKHNVNLSAALAPGAAPLSEGLSWRILKLNNAKKDPELIWSGGGGGPELTLRPGRYYAEVTYGLVKDGSEFEVVANKPVAPIVSLDAGTLHVRGVAIPGGPSLDNMFFTLRDDQVEAGDPDADIGRSSLPQAVFHVPTGEYRLIARHGLATVEMPVTVSAGDDKPIEAVMNSANLTLSAHAKADSPPLSGATFLVYENGEAGRHRELIRSKLGEPTFSLPAGHYRIAAVLGLAQIEQDVTIKPGEELRENLILNAGGIRLNSLLAGNGSLLDQNLLYRIFELSEENGKLTNKEILTSTLPSPTIFLPSGRYRIESQYGWHNARQAQEVKVAAGDVIKIGFEHKASDVKLKLVTRPGGENLDHVKWTLKYNGGGTVLISQDAAPVLILQAGNYQAVAQYNDKTYTQTFEAVSNREQIVEIVMQ